MTILKRFFGNPKGSVATIFALSIVPVIGAMAIGIDYTRAATARSSLQKAIDSAALTVAKETRSLNAAQLEIRARQIFDANYKPVGWAPVTNFRAVRAGDRVTVEARARVRAQLLPVIGKGDIDIAWTSEASFGNTKIELALVLDNTGSMATSGKMDALKQASHALLNTLEAVVNQPGDVKISIVPFDTHVKIGTSHNNAPWLRFTPADPAANGATWLNWTGCVTDRDQPHDAADTAPINGDTATRYLASNCPNGALTALRPLTTNFTDLRTTINAMQPSGCTNVTIGTHWGLATLSQGDPLTQAVAFGQPGTLKVMIVLTDGWNTRNRFVNACGGGGGNAGLIDARTQAACDAVKARGVRVYTIRVIEGSATLLQACAGNGGSYYDVQNVNQLTPVFQGIANEIKGIRLTS